MAFPVSRASTDTFILDSNSRTYSAPYLGSLSARCFGEEQNNKKEHSKGAISKAFRQALRELERVHERELSAALRHEREGHMSPPNGCASPRPELEDVRGIQRRCTDGSVSSSQDSPVPEAPVSLNGVSLNRITSKIGRVSRQTSNQGTNQSMTGEESPPAGSAMSEIQLVTEDTLELPGSVQQLDGADIAGCDSDGAIDTSANILLAQPAQSESRFGLREWWRQDFSRGVERKVSFSRRSGGVGNLLSAPSSMVLPVGPPPRRRWYMVHPNSAKRMVWDLISMSLLAYDIMVIPFVGAFEPPASSFLVGMTWSTLIFWTADMPLSALTGYQKGKEVILEPAMTLRHYCRTWFFLDTIIVALDFLMLFLFGSEANVDANDGSAFRLGRTLRTLRFVRTLRLVRVLKLKRIVQAIQDSINTEAVSIVFGVCKIILFLVIANHIVACGWYSVAFFAVDSQGRSWVTEAGMHERSIVYRYMTSLHWSLTQFTPASMEVVPENSGERVYTVLVIIFAMIAFSSFVSLLTASMAQLQALSSNESRQFWLLRRYLRDWNVRRYTSVRVQRYLEYAYQKQKLRVQEGEVKLLSLLSEPLRLELKHETFSQHLSGHPLFNACNEQARIFGKALAATSLASNDLIFECGEQARMVTFLTGGALVYTLGLREELAMSSQLPHAPNGARETLQEGAWICEVVLWTDWYHLGDLCALTECQVVTVSASIFAQSVQTSAPLWSALRKYAANFLDNLNQVDVDDLTDLTSQLFSPEEALDRADFRAENESSFVQAPEDDETNCWTRLRQCMAKTKKKQPPQKQKTKSEAQQTAQTTSDKARADNLKAAQAATERLSGGRSNGRQRFVEFEFDGAIPDK